MQLTRKQIHEQVYFYTLILIAISLPLSTYTTSMFQLLLMPNYLVELRYREKWKKARFEPGPADLFTLLHPAPGGTALVRTICPMA